MFDGVRRTRRGPCSPQGRDQPTVNGSPRSGISRVFPGQDRPRESYHQPRITPAPSQQMSISKHKPNSVKLHTGNKQPSVAIARLDAKNSQPDTDPSTNTCRRSPRLSVNFSTQQTLISQNKASLDSKSASQQTKSMEVSSRQVVTKEEPKSQLDTKEGRFSLPKRLRSASDGELWQGFPFNIPRTRKDKKVTPVNDVSNVQNIKESEIHVKHVEIECSTTPSTQDRRKDGHTPQKSSVFIEEHLELNTNNNAGNNEEKSPMKTRKRGEKTLRKVEEKGNKNERICPENLDKDTLIHEKLMGKGATLEKNKAYVEDAKVNNNNIRGYNEQKQYTPEKTPDKCCGKAKNDNTQTNRIILRIPRHRLSGVHDNKTTSISCAAKKGLQTDGKKGSNVVTNDGKAVTSACESSLISVKKTVANQLFPVPKRGKQPDLNTAKQTRGHGRESSPCKTNVPLVSQKRSRTQLNVISSGPQQVNLSEIIQNGTDKESHIGQLKQPQTNASEGKESDMYYLKRSPRLQNKRRVINHSDQIRDDFVYPALCKRDSSPRDKTPNRRKDDPGHGTKTPESPQKSCSKSGHLLEDVITDTIKITKPKDVSAAKGTPKKTKFVGVSEICTPTSSTSAKGRTSTALMSYPDKCRRTSRSMPDPKMRSMSHLLQSLPQSSPRMRKQANVDLLKETWLENSACTLWSSEQRRHFQQQHQGMMGSSMEDVMRAAWRKLGDQEKAKYFMRAKNATAIGSKRTQSRDRRRRPKPRRLSKTRDMSSTDLLKTTSVTPSKIGFHRMTIDCQFRLLHRKLCNLQRVLPQPEYQTYLSEYMVAFRSAISLPGFSDVAAKKDGEYVCRKATKLLYEMVTKMEDRVQNLDDRRKFLEALHQKGRYREIVQGLIVAEAIYEPRASETNSAQSEKISLALDVLQDYFGDTQSMSDQFPDAEKPLLSNRFGEGSKVDNRPAVDTFCKGDWFTTSERDLEDHRQVATIADELRAFADDKVTSLVLSGEEVTIPLVTNQTLETSLLQNVACYYDVIGLDAGEVAAYLEGIEQGYTVCCTGQESVTSQDQLLNNSAKELQTCCLSKSPSCLLSTILAGCCENMDGFEDCEPLTETPNANIDCPLWSNDVLYYDPPNFQYQGLDR